MSQQKKVRWGLEFVCSEIIQATQSVNTQCPESEQYMFNIKSKLRSF